MLFAAGGGGAAATAATATAAGSSTAVAIVVLVHVGGRIVLNLVSGIGRVSRSRKAFRAFAFDSRLKEFLWGRCIWSGFRIIPSLFVGILAPRTARRFSRRKPHCNDMFHCHVSIALVVLQASVPALKHRDARLGQFCTSQSSTDPGFQRSSCMPL